MADVKIIESGSGGDLVLKGNDFELIEGLQNMPYIAMFGGNKEQSTKEFLPAEERLDYWANELFMLQEPEQQYNSTLEKLLENISINSSSLLQIEDSVKKDLSFMSGFAEVECEAFAESVDRVRIEIKITKPDSIETPLFIYIWDATKNELEIIQD